MLSSRDEFELQIHPLELLSPLGRMFSTVNLDQEEEVGGRLQEGEISRNIFWFWSKFCEFSPPSISPSFYFYNLIILGERWGDIGAGTSRNG